jgi:hypothetical protein
MRNDKTIFERNPKKTILLVLLMPLFFDIVLSKTYYTLKASRWGKNKIVIKNEIYHHDFVKNGSSGELQSAFGTTYQINTNSLGFKDKVAREVALQTPKHRILFIGDSFTEGVALSYQDTFVGLIDSELKEKGIDVLNAGRSSYSPIIYWRKIKYLIEEVGLKFDEVIVYIDISDIQDEAINYKLSNTIDETVISRKPYIRTLISENTFVVKKLLILYDLLSLNKEQQRQATKEKGATKNTGAEKWDAQVDNSKLNIASLRGKWTFNEKAYNTFGKHGIELAKIYMTKLLNLLKNNSIDLTVAVYPWPDQILYEDLNSLQVEIWKNWAQDNQVKFINYFPDFVKKDSSQADKLQTLRKFYFPGDVHFNKAGSQVLARKFINSWNLKPAYPPG